MRNRGFVFLGNDAASLGKWFAILY